MMKGQEEKQRRCEYRVQRTGEDVSNLLDRIASLGPASAVLDGLLTAADKKKLDGIGIRYNTTAYWNRQIGFVPKPGEIIIYSDYKTAVVDGRTTTLPGIKIGSGNAYVQDLAFITGGGTDEDLLLSHIADTVVHVTQGDKDFWNNKLNVTDAQEVVGEALIFNRN